MTLSVMENQDVFKTALKEYQTNLGEIPKVLERYLEYVARTGRPLFSWDMMSDLVVRKLENAIEEYTFDKMNCNRSNGDNIMAIVDKLKVECVKVIKELNGVPFTIQRVSELLMSPKRHYSKVEKFLRGFLRVIKVVTVVGRRGEKITTESQMLSNSMSPIQINESGDSWTGSLGHFDDCSSNNNSSGGNNCDSPVSDSNMVNEESSGIVQPIFGTSHFYPEQHSRTATTAATETAVVDNGGNSISMPPIRALLKPIDQLEAFVQQVPVGESDSGSQQQADNSNRRDIDQLPEEQDEDEYNSPAKRRRLMDDSTSTVTTPSSSSDQVANQVSSSETTSISNAMVTDDHLDQSANKEICTTEEDQCQSTSNIATTTDTDC